MLIIIVKTLQLAEQKFREAKELAGAMQPINGRIEVTPPPTVCRLLSTQGRMTAATGYTWKCGV